MQLLFLLTIFSIPFCYNNCQPDLTFGYIMGMTYIMAAAALGLIWLDSRHAGNNLRGSTLSLSESLSSLRQLK